MTWARVKETGSGAIAYRLMIPGCPVEFVSSPELVGASSDGRVRVDGLDPRSISWGERLDPAMCKLTARGFTAKIIEDGAHRTGDALVKLPTTIAHLSASVTASDVAIPLTNTYTANGDVIYIGQECMLITSGGGTAAPTVTRGYRQTTPQAHIVSDTQSRAEVTDAAPSIEGQMAYLYAYGDGETSNDVPVWCGVCSTHPRLRGTTTWEITLDSVTALLDQPLYGDLQDPVGLRGITYPSHAVPTLSIRRRAGSTPLTADTADTAEVAIPAGFYESNDDFCRAVNTAITTATSGWGANALNVASGALPRLSALPTSDGSWSLQYTTDASAYWLEIQCAGPLDPTIQNTGRVFLASGSSTRVSTLAASTSYDVPTSYPVPGAGTVPRGYVGRYNFRTERGVVTSIEPNLVYLGGSASLSSNDQLTVKWPAWNGQPARALSYSVLAWDATDRFATVHFVNRDLSAMTRAYTREGAPEITVTRTYVLAGNVADFLTTLTTDAPAQAPLGRQPFVTTAHVDAATTQTNVDAAVSGRAWVDQRYYGGSSDITLSKLLIEECKLAGLVPSIGTDGRMTLVQFRIGASTEATSYTIDASTNLSGVHAPGFEVAPFGLVNTIKVLSGFDPLSGKHEGDQYIVRDSAALSRSPLPRMMKIEPRSSAFAGDITISIADIVAMAQTWLGTMGAAYTTLTVACPLSAIDSVIGSGVNITIPQLPNASDGGRGITRQTGVVIGRDVKPLEACVELTVMTTQIRIAGYAPSSRVTSVTALGGGLYDVLLDDPQPDGYATAVDWIVTDAIELQQYDVAGSTSITATVTAVNPATRKVTIGSLSAGVPAGVLNLEYGAAAVATAHQQEYCYIAQDDDRIGFAVPVPPRQFAS